MTDLYTVKVNNSHEFKVASKDIENLDVIKEVDLKFHILQNNTSYKAEITQANFNSKIYQVKVNNNTYNINIFSDLDKLIKEMGFEVGTTKIINNIKAPMPGLILDINVKTGQEVNENDPLLILEAMKMENILVSPRAGIIKTIAVTKAEAVDKNQLLIEFE